MNQRSIYIHDLHDPHEPQDQLNWNIDWGLENGMSMHYTVDMEDTQMPQQGQLSTNLDVPVAQHPLLWESSSVTQSIMREHQGQLAYLVQPESSIAWSYPYGAAPLPTQQEFPCQMAPMDGPVADSGSWRTEPSFCAGSATQSTIRFRNSQDWFKDDLGLLAQDHFPEEGEPSVTCNGELQPKMTPHDPEVNLPQGMPSIPYRRIPAKKEPSPKPQSNLQMPDWNEVEKNLEYLTGEGWTREEMATAFGIGHPGIKASTGTLQNKFRIKEMQQSPQPRPNSAHGSTNVPSDRWSSKSTRKRRRGQALAPRLPVPPSSRVLSWKHSYVCFRLTQRPDPVKEPWNWQYKMLHAIDGLTKALFDLGPKGWNAPELDFVARDNRISRLTGWQLLSDQCDGIAGMARPFIGQKVAYLLFRTVEQIRNLVGDPGPGFLVYFWRICITLSTIRLRSSERPVSTPFLRKFLWHLRDELLKHTPSMGQENDPFIVLVDAIIHILEATPRSLKESLGLGCWKTISMLSWLLGTKAKSAHDHPIVLRIGVDCAKTMRVRGCGVSLEETTLRSKYETILEQSTLDGIESQASILYDYLYAVSRRKNDSDQVQHLAQKLRSLTLDTCAVSAGNRRLVYDSVTRAFAFASEILALSHLKSWTSENEGTHEYRRRLTSQYMSEAIEILRCGDTNCHVVAATMSKQLEVWIKSYVGHPGKTKGVTEKERKALEARKVEHQVAMRFEKKRTSEIMALIDVPEYLVIKGKDERKTGTSKNNIRRRKQANQRDKVITQLLHQGQSTQ